MKFKVGDKVKLHPNKDYVKIDLKEELKNGVLSFDHTYRVDSIEPIEGWEGKIWGKYYYYGLNNLCYFPETFLRGVK